MVCYQNSHFANHPKAFNNMMQYVLYNSSMLISNIMKYASLFVQETKCDSKRLNCSLLFCC